MAYLKLQKIDGSSELRELSRSQPLTIGRQQYNDICVPEASVNPFHCRIGWNKSRYEMTSGSSNGVDVNSREVIQADLKDGDVIRVGSLDLIYQDEPPSSVQRKSRKKEQPEAKPADDMSLFDGPVMTESEAMMEAVFDEMDQEPVEELPTLERKPSSKPEPKQKKNVRPGEQEVLRSPLVLTLSAGAAVLLLLTGVFWFLYSREQSKLMFERANSEMSGGQFVQAIATFERFIQTYPSNSLKKAAQRGLAKAQVLKEISGGSPSWKRGLDQLNDLIKTHRNDTDFSELHSALFQFADQIAIGAAKSAEQGRDPEMLEISKEAQVLLERYADPSTPPVGSLGRISEQRVKAERAIEKQKLFDQSMKIIDDAVANKNPMAALSERERLVRRFADFASQARVREALQKSLDLEKSAVNVDDTERPADMPEDSAFTQKASLAILHTRSRTDETSTGQIVLAVAKDSCYGIDATTGEPVWRRVIGANLPFFPMVMSDATSNFLTFDSRTNALVACQLSNGKPIWRQILNARAIGRPLIHEGQIYLAVEGKSLVRVDAESGRLTATVHFSQDLATSPTITRDGNYLLAPGDMAMIYSLTLRSTAAQPTLSAVATTFTDHAAGSITAPALSMGKLLLLCENDRADSARLRLWDAGNPTEPLAELASARTAGQVRDTPVLRGNQLVVPSAGEQFAAFAVTDETGKAGIAPIGQYRADVTHSGGLGKAPVFVTLGSDGQFWSASSAFRRFEIGSDSIRMDSNSTAAGIASQPIQLSGDYFYVGRKFRYSDAVTFSAIERDRLINPWRCIVGDAPLELMPTRDGGIVSIGESGSLYNLSKNRIAQGGFDTRAGTDLDLPPNISSPIRATLLSDGRMAVATAGDTKQLLLINNAGQTAGKYPLPDMLEADPILIDQGIVLPLPGRLKLLPLGGGKKNIEDWKAPTGDTTEQRWTHLVKSDGHELIACTSTGRLARIQYRQGDVPHLAEVAKLQLEHPIDLRPILRGEHLHVVEANGTCRQLNVHSFDTDGQRSLPASISNMWSVGEYTIVQAGDQKLHCLADGKDLPERWTFDLEKLDPTGAIISRDGSLWLACRNGTVLALNAQTGEEQRRIDLPQAISLGLKKLDQSLVAVAVDGTVYSIE